MWFPPPLSFLKKSFISHGDNLESLQNSKYQLPKVLSLIGLPLFVWCTKVLIIIPGALLQRHLKWLAFTGSCVLQGNRLDISVFSFQDKDCRMWLSYIIRILYTLILLEPAKGFFVCVFVLLFCKEDRCGKEVETDGIIHLNPLFSVKTQKS